MRAAPERERRQIDDRHWRALVLENTGHPCGYARHDLERRKRQHALDLRTVENVAVLIEGELDEEHDLPGRQTVATLKRDTPVRRPLAVCVRSSMACVDCRSDSAVCCAASD